MSQRWAEGALWNTFEEFVMYGNLFSFTDHAGIDLQDVPAERVWDEFKAHYTRNNRLDMDHFLKDFSTWGPIASRIVELQLERDAKAGK
jgi:hypothetical protein